MAFFKPIALATGLAAAFSVNALADDLTMPMAPPLLPQTQPVTFGSGWYLRGDLGWAFDRESSISTDDSFSSTGSTGSGLEGDLGFGYELNDWLRTDLTFDYRKPISASSSTNASCPVAVDGISNAVTGVAIGITPVYAACSQNAQVKLDRSDLLGNFYIDLGSWRGVTPYVGAGLGLAIFQLSGGTTYLLSSNQSDYQATISYPSGYPLTWVNGSGQPIATPNPAIPPGNYDWNKSFNHVTYNFAFALMGGFSYDLTTRLKLDLGYRFVDLGTYLAVVNAASGETIRERTTIQEVRLGLRYMLDM